MGCPAVVIGTTDLRASHGRFFTDQIKPTIALTLTYQHVPVTMDKICNDLCNLHAEIECRLYGRRFYKRPPSMRTQFWAVVEKLDINPHVHLGWQLPCLGIETLDYALQTERIWLRFAPHGTYNIQPYRSGWSGYSLKCLTDSNQIIMSADFAPQPTQPRATTT